MDRARLFVDSKDDHERPFQGMGQHWKHFRQQTIAGRQLGEAGLVFVGKVRLVFGLVFIGQAEISVLKLHRIGKLWLLFE
jgi:hypothetical protein